MSTLIETAPSDLLRFPIGKFEAPEIIAEDHIAQYIQDIAALPAQVREAVAGLSSTQLDTPYRPGGWTVRQVVHHLPDSHLNSYVRFKLALTEDNPTIKPYAEEHWAELADGKYADIAVSLALLESLHQRWVILLESLSPQEWERTFRHPDSGTLTLSKTAGLYSWHGRHHLAHITNLRRVQEW